MADQEAGHNNDNGIEISGFLRDMGLGQMPDAEHGEQRAQMQDPMPSQRAKRQHTLVDDGHGTIEKQAKRG